MCPGDCLRQNMRIMSVLIVGSQTTEDATLSSEGEVLVSGYSQVYQPIRILDREVRAGSLQLECEAGECWAMVTVEADTNITQCGNNKSGDTYCVDQHQRRNLG